MRTGLEAGGRPHSESRSRSRSRSRSKSLSSRQTMNGSQAVGLSPQCSERSSAASLFGGISFFVQPTHDPFHAERLKQRIRDAGGIVHNTPVHPAVTIMIVFPRPDAPTNLVVTLQSPRLTHQQLVTSGRWDLHSLVWHYARLVVDGQTQPERKIKNQTGYKSTRVFTADWVNVMIKTDHCDIKTGRYDYLHREILRRSGGGLPAYQPRADRRPRLAPLSPARREYRSSPVATPQALLERIGGAGVPPGESRPVYNPNSKAELPSASDRVAGQSGPCVNPNQVSKPSSMARGAERTARPPIPLRERLSPRQASQQRTGGSPESLQSSTSPRRSFPADSPSTPSKRPRLDPPSGPNSSQEDREATPRPSAVKGPPTSSVTATLPQERHPKVEVKLEPFDSWIVVADIPLGKYEMKRLATGRSALGSSTTPTRATEPPGAKETERQSTEESGATPSARAVAPSSPEVPLAYIRRKTSTPLSTQPAAGPTAPTVAAAHASTTQTVTIRTESAAPPTPVTAGMDASALGLRNIFVPRFAAPTASLTKISARSGALVGPYGLRNTFCTDYCGRGSMILNPFITLNGGLVTPVTRATFILLPLDPSQVTENADDRAILEAVDEAQTVLSDRYVADSIAAGVMLPIEEYKIRLDP